MPSRSGVSRERFLVVVLMADVLSDHRKLAKMLEQDLPGPATDTPQRFVLFPIKFQRVRYLAREYTL